MLGRLADGEQLDKEWISNTRGPSIHLLINRASARSSQRFPLNTTTSDAPRADNDFVRHRFRQTPVARPDARLEDGAERCSAGARRGAVDPVGEPLHVLAVALCPVLSARARETNAAVVTDASLFEGPADPEAEALSKAWGPEETFVVLPRLASLRGDVPWIEQLSWSPRAQVYHNFLTPEECDHLIALARDEMSVASVVDKKTGASRPSACARARSFFATPR